MHLFYSLSTAIGAGILSYNLFDGDIKTTVAISLLVFGYIGSLLFVSQAQTKKTHQTARRQGCGEESIKQPLASWNQEDSPKED